MDRDSDDEFYNPRRRGQRQRGFPKKRSHRNPDPPKPVYQGALDIENIIKCAPKSSSKELTQEELDEAIAAIEQVHQFREDVEYLRDPRNTKEFFPPDPVTGELGCSRYPFLRGNRPPYIKEIVAGPQPRLDHTEIWPITRAEHVGWYTNAGWGTADAEAHGDPRPPRVLHPAHDFYSKSWCWVPEGYDYFGYRLPRP